MLLLEGFGGEATELDRLIQALSEFRSFSTPEIIITIFNVFQLFDSKLYYLYSCANLHFILV